MTLWFVGATAMSSTLPPMLAGPIDRNRKLESTGFADRLTGIESRRGGACATSVEPVVQMSAAAANSAALERWGRRMGDSFEVNPLGLISGFRSYYGYGL